MFSFKKSVPWVACAALVACGGSSDLTDNPVGEPLAIAAANYLTVTQEVLMTSFSLVDTSEVLVYGAKVSTLPKPLSYARQQLPQLPKRVLNLGRLVAGTVYDDTALCTDGGTITVSFDDRDNNGIVSAGDVLTETFNNCVELGETANGTLRFAFNTLTGDLQSTVFAAKLTLSFEVFRVTSAAGSVLPSCEASVAALIPGAPTSSAAGCAGGKPARAPADLRVGGLCPNRSDAGSKLPG